MRMRGRGVSEVDGGERIGGRGEVVGVVGGC